MCNADTQLEPYRDAQMVNSPLVNSTLVERESVVVALAPPNQPPHQNDALVLVDPRDSDNKTLFLIVKTIRHFRQFIAGSLFGTVLALSLMEFGVTSKTAPLNALFSNTRQTSTMMLLSLELALRNLEFKDLISPVQVPPPPVAASANPSLQPVMMDRFYLPSHPTNPAAKGQAPSASTAIVVDRFYFANQAGNMTVFNATQRLQDMPITLMPPPPLPSDQGYARVNSMAPEALPHPSAEPLPRTTKPYTLVGIIQTGQFSAALFQTDDNSYSVRLGESVGPSDFDLVDLNDQAVILSDGQAEVVMYVGDTL